MRRLFQNTLAFGLFLFPLLTQAQDFLCAEVKIEIRQELTLERQAFEARMRIINDLNLPLNDINVVVEFFDTNGDVVLASSNPNDPNPDVKFFITENDGGVPSSVGGESDTRFTWLIIPTITAGGETPAGINYEVGATLTYKVGSNTEEERVEVAPDTILVLPLPELQLDYFLPYDVYGDNPDTTTRIEEAEPFSLAVRVANIGFGEAKNVKIDSAQPTIVENDLGLLIDFKITGTEVNGLVEPNSLLVDFGDLPPISEAYAGVGRWIMESTLSGRFTQFDATVSHADELGGELTALISQENLHTHTLVKEVLVDLPGRDLRMDFLGTEREDPSDFAVYESSGVDTEVVDNTVGDGSALPKVGSDYEFTLTGEAGFTYVKFIDPFGGNKQLASVVRSDGKEILEENAWLNRTWNKDLDRWDYWFHLFDGANLSAPTYAVNFENKPDVNVAPVMQLILDRTTVPGIQVGFLVVATDLNNDSVSITADGLPSGANFNLDINEAGRTSYLFSWTPAADQLGSTTIRFVASDPEGLEDSQVVHIDVTSNAGEGFESYLSRYFGDETDPAIIGPGVDFDMDGMSNLSEYGQNTNPTLPDRELGPTVSVVEVSGDLFLEISFRRRLDDTSLSFIVQGFDAVGTLRTDQSSNIVDSTTEGVPEGMERLTVRDSVPITSSTPRRFLELIVTRTLP